MSNIEGPPAKPGGFLFLAKWVTTLLALDAPLSLWERLHDAYVATCALEHCRAVSSLTPGPSPRGRGEHCVPADAGRFLGRGWGVRPGIRGPWSAPAERHRLASRCAPCKGGSRASCIYRTLDRDRVRFYSYCFGIPAALMTCAHLRVSLPMKAANSAEVPPRSCRPTASAFWRIVASASTAFVSVLSRRTIAAGVPAGTSSPYQP